MEVAGMEGHSRIYLGRDFPGAIGIFNNSLAVLVTQFVKTHKTLHLRLRHVTVYNYIPNFLKK